MIEHCRDCYNESKVVEAEYLLWGKLLPPEALGPKCYEHGVEHVGHRLLTDKAAAIFNLAKLRGAIELLLALQDKNKTDKVLDGMSVEEKSRAYMLLDNARSLAYESMFKEVLVDENL